jgi:hypothetical protein
MRINCCPIVPRLVARFPRFIARAGFVHAMTSFMQPERFEQIPWKARDGIGIEFARYPKMFIKNRFQISSHDSFGNRSGVSLTSTRQYSLKQRR